VLDRSPLPSGKEKVLIPALTDADTRFGPKALLDGVPEGNTLIQLSWHQSDLAEKARLKAKNAGRLVRNDFDDLISRKRIGKAGKNETANGRPMSSHPFRLVRPENRRHQ
jgi:hypothetical protein